MSNEIIGIIGLSLLLVLIAARIWIGMSLAMVGFVGIWLMNGWRTAIGTVVTAPFSQLDNYVMTAIPMFTLMGMIVAETSMGRNAFDCANKFLSRIRGGLPTATVATAGMVGAVTGSDNVSSVIISKLALPELKRVGCNDSLATASVAAASPIAILLPPSMAFIVFGMLSETSVAALFMAGVIPGIVVLIAYTIAVQIVCRIKPSLCPLGAEFTRKEKLKSLKGIVPILLLFLAILGSIYMGVATPTEAGAIGTFGALLIAIVGRDINFKRLKTIVMETAITSAFILFLLMGVSLFIRFMALSRLPFWVSDIILGLDVSPMTVMVWVAVMYFVIGTMLPQIPLQMLTVPVLAPTMEALGFDLIWFGVFVIIVMGTAAVTPPIGMNVFIVSGISKVPVTTIYRGILPFVLADFVVIALLFIFPMMALWLPQLMLSR